MATSLANLAENLSSANLNKFREVSKVFNPSEMALATRKGVYPYEYTDSWDKLCVTSLPDKFQFYSALTETHVSDVDYNHALRVRNHFGCTTLGTLQSVLENRRADKFTKVQLSLLMDFEKVLFIESGTRDGLVQASKRHVRANNTKTPGYNADDPARPLYNYMVIIKYKLFNVRESIDFEWYPGNPEIALAQLEWMSETDDVGRIYEVDISYSQHLHDAHNDMPFLPHASIPHGSSVRKLMVTFLRKELYVVHYMNLKQAMAHSVVVKKTHRVLEFRQSPWLAPYINLNTELRK
ncbi:hypothetical protein AGLY_016635 [Aphis glycines]|uniref:Uncharacterized protein n=1 Tax=Aphis glycines TaxID=307491 RepID=A0A6G0SYG9_APHGL|nr:hypothetical protein AGLY_016635 [Aphis glycines]